MDGTPIFDIKPYLPILQNIFNYSKEHNITTFIASQKTSTVKNCSRILVFNNGKIENIGTHTELLNSSELYKKIYELQNSISKGA